MEIREDVVLPFDRRRVFAAYRDRLVELVPHLPNIQSITVTSRVDRGTDTDFVNEWVGGGDIPKVVRSVIKESMLRWTDFATWHEEDFTVSWRTEVHAFPGAVSSAGKNRYVAVSESSTRIELRGDLTIDASKVPAVPRFLERTVADAAEKMIVSQVKTNLVAVARGVERILAAEG